MPTSPLITRLFNLAATLIFVFICLFATGREIYSQQEPIPPGLPGTFEDAILGSAIQGEPFRLLNEAQTASVLSPSSLQTVVAVTPQSPTTIGNCFPFGSNNNFDQRFMGFIYKNIPAFTVHAGDRIAFDLGRQNDVDIKRTIFIAAANINPVNGTMAKVFALSHGHK